MQSSPSSVSVPLRAGFIRRLGFVPALIVLVLFLVLPLVALFGAAVSDHGSAFGRIVRDPLAVMALAHSLVLACAAGSVSVLIGLPLAVLLHVATPAKRRLLLALLGIPLAFSGLVVAYGFILAFGRAGFVTGLLALAGTNPASVGAMIYTAAGLVVAYAYYLIPRVALMLYPTIANLDTCPIHAAMSLGARPLRALIDVALVELWPSIAGAWCLVTSIALGTYGTALALAGTQINILPLLMYMKISDGQNDFPQAAALSIVLMAVCTAVLALGEALGKHRH